MKVLAGGSLGAILGAAVAYVGAAYVFVCRSAAIPIQGGTYYRDCAGPNVLLALLWGVPIGLAVGLMMGLILGRRASSRLRHHRNRWAP